MTRGTRKAHFVRAALEAMAYQTRDVLDAMQSDAGIALTELRADGGAIGNDFLASFQADILGVPLLRPRLTETTALGAAYLAGLAVGFWSSREQIAAQWGLTGASSHRWRCRGARSCMRDGSRRLPPPSPSTSIETAMPCPALLRHVE